MLKRIINKFFPSIVKAKYHYDDRLLFVYYSNGKRKIFQGSGVLWTDIENMRKCDNIRLIDTLSKIKIEIDKTGEIYVKNNME